MKRGGETSSMNPQQPEYKVLMLERWVIYVLCPSVMGFYFPFVDKKEGKKE